MLAQVFKFVPSVYLKFETSGLRKLGGEVGRRARERAEEEVKQSQVTSVEPNWEDRKIRIFWREQPNTFHSSSRDREEQGCRGQAGKAAVGVKKV